MSCPKVSSLRIEDGLPANKDFNRWHMIQNPSSLITVYWPAFHDSDFYELAPRQQ
jgi:hypothetical protein